MTTAMSNPVRRGLPLSVLRPAPRGDSFDSVDTTAGGISSRFPVLTLVGHIDQRENAGASVVEPMLHSSQVFPETSDRPAVALVVRSVGQWVLSLVPVEWNGREGRYERCGGWLMAGGNYASLDDSRVSALTERLTGHRFYGAVAVHDRRE